MKQWQTPLHCFMTKAYVKEKSEKRTKIQAEIEELRVQRKKFVAEEMKKLSKTGANTFDAVIIKAVRKLAAKKNFKFKE